MILDEQGEAAFMEGVSKLLPEGTNYICVIQREGEILITAKGAPPGKNGVALALMNVANFLMANPGKVDGVDE